MKLSIRKSAIKNFKTDGLVIGVFEDEVKGPDITHIDKSLDGYIKRAVKNKLFNGKPGQTLLVDSLGGLPARKILLAGLGKKGEATPDTVRKAAAKTASTFRAAGVRKYATALGQVSIAGCDRRLVSQAVAEGTWLSQYCFERLKSEKRKKKIDSVTFIASSAKDEGAMKHGVRKGRILAESACLARDLINSPGNVATPLHLADQAKKLARDFKMKVKTLDPKAIAKHKMGALMAVAKGSHQPARFIIMEWMKGPKSQRPVVLVGKGLTFDTGGISLKPSGNMEEMKSDMSGGAAVIGAMRAAAALDMKVNLVGLVPATENMPGGSAVKPGDVVTGLSGVTMEVINTDAEGRLILSDALAYASRYKPECVVDIATLTGACMIALGEFASGLFGTDEELVGQIKQAGEETGERCWPMPLWKEYEDLIKSDVADIKNVGPRWGGAITAAAFLNKSVKGKWAHIDIAGTAYSSKARSYLTRGAAGIGVRLFIRFIEIRCGIKA
ncbi:Cytosol aminopeptidase PepA [hydrothermal vent metagenome]|uniref:leucyl aminopeptidase n=1 Tax=hydrothermal vent metagenome TaxID=652676 RepID=A0A3B1CFE4_9ZZZZ